MKSIRMIRSWIQSNPFTAVLFTFWFTMIPTIMAFREDWIPYCLIAYVIVLSCYVASLWKHLKRTATAALVVIAFLSSPVQTTAKEPEPVFQPAAGIAVGVVVVCAFGYCTYRMVRYCQEKFPPKSTNSNDGFMASGEDEYAGVYEYSSIGSCYQPPLRPGALPYEDLSQNPTTFTLNVLAGQDGITTSMTANNKEGTAQTWTQFQAEMAGHGLFLTGHASYQPQFSKGGVPCDASQVPLEFDQMTGRVTQRTGGDLRRVVVERSQNLTDWASLLVTDVGAGTRFKVVDTTSESQMFYRISMVQPQDNP